MIHAQVLYEEYGDVPEDIEAEDVISVTNPAQAT